MDDLTIIKGIGPATAKKLAAAGIDGFARLAAMQPTDKPLIELARSQAEAEAWIAEALAALKDKIATAGAGGPAAADTPPPPVGSGPDDQLGDSDEGEPLDQAMTRQAFREAHPLLAAAVEAWAASLTGEFREPVIRIASRRDGFRRCGVAHPKAPTDHEAGRFSPAELERLLAEPVLTVELV
jgi:predicted RecB family nuclease